MFHYTVILFRMFYFLTGDSMAYHNGNAFTTQDRDNDVVRRENCAVKYKGAWWYQGCHNVNLNGMYAGKKAYAGINWNTFKRGQPMKTTSMMMRKISNNN